MRSCCRWAPENPNVLKYPGMNGSETPTVALADDPQRSPGGDRAGLALEIELKVSMPGIPVADAEEIIKRGHVVCPYSYSIKGNVKVTTTVV